jgi:hypothetical protein
MLGVLSSDRQGLEDDKFRADAPDEMQKTATRWRVPRKLKVQM